MTGPDEPVVARGEAQTTAQATTQATALAPVAAALVARARAQAARVVAEAERDAAEELEAARRRAGRILAEARADGRVEGDALAASERARARREARSLLLAARADAYDELRRRTREGVRALRDDPCHPRLLARLAELAGQVAGPGPSGAGGLTITELPDGGIEATAPGLRIDLSAAVLADRAVELLGAEVRELWEPRSPG